MSEDCLGIDRIGVAVNDLDSAIHTSQNVPGLHGDGGETVADLQNAAPSALLAAFAMAPTPPASHLSTLKACRGALLALAQRHAAQQEPT